MNSPSLDCKCLSVNIYQENKLMTFLEGQDLGIMSIKRLHNVQEKFVVMIEHISFSCKYDLQMNQ